MCINDPNTCTPPSLKIQRFNFLISKYLFLLVAINMNCFDRRERENIFNFKFPSARSNKFVENYLISNNSTLIAFFGFLYELFYEIEFSFEVSSLRITNGNLFLWMSYLCFWLKINIQKEFKTLNKIVI